jgi:hypothetical protein
VPGGGITLPKYYRPTSYLVSNNIYYLGQEQIGPDEMRISFIGSTPIPVTKAQAGTCIMVELGTARSSSSISAPAACATSSRWRTVTDGQRYLLHPSPRRSLRGPSLPLRLALWMGRWKPLRVHGHRAGRPGTVSAHDRRHEDDDPLAHGLFNASPIGDGYEVEVNEFDFRDDNGFATTRMA